MIAYGVLLIGFWIYVRQWLDQLYGHTTNIARIILWLGVVGAIFFIVYIDFLGTTGEVNRFMRRYGISYAHQLPKYYCLDNITIFYQLCKKVL